MLFASRDLAARIEQAECRLLTDAAAPVRERLPDSCGTLVEPIGGGVAIVTEPGSPLNKIAGLGFAGPADATFEALVDKVERACAAHTIPAQAELSSLADPSFGTVLTGRGYVLVGVENVLGRPLPGDGPSLDVSSEEISIGTCTDDEIATWIDVVVTGFASPDEQGVPSHESYPRDAIEPVMRDLARADGFVQYLARRRGEPVGGASLRVHGGVAQLCGATTLPEHRRRGVQTALLFRRLADANDAGCDVAIITTQPGSKSQENAQRRGFNLLYTRAVLVREV